MAVFLRLGKLGKVKVHDVWLVGRRLCFPGLGLLHRRVLGRRGNFCHKVPLVLLGGIRVGGVHNHAHIQAEAAHRAVKIVSIVQPGGIGSAFGHGKGQAVGDQSRNQCEPPQPPAGFPGSGEQAIADDRQEKQKDSP